MSAGLIAATIAVLEFPPTHTEIQRNTKLHGSTVNKGGVVADSFIRRYFMVEVFQFSYLRDPAADKFQNLIVSSLSTDTSVVKFT